MPTIQALQRSSSVNKTYPDHIFRCAHQPTIPWICNWHHFSQARPPGFAFIQNTSRGLHYTVACRLRCSHAQTYPVIVGRRNSLRVIKTEFPTMSTRFEGEHVGWNQYAVRRVVIAEVKRPQVRHLCIARPTLLAAASTHNTCRKIDK